MKRLIRLLLSRTSLILVLLLFQFALFFLLVDYLSQFGNLDWLLYGLSVIIVIYLVANEDNPMYKLSWVIPILIFPLFGGFFYLFYRQRNVSQRVIQRMEKARSHRFNMAREHGQDDDRLACYLARQGYLPDDHSSGQLLTSDQAMLDQLIDDLNRATSFIFLEYFIISKGVMWSKISAVLEQKVTEGVEVKVIYDDFGSSTLPYHYAKTLQKKGIQATSFNPMRLHINFAMNYRDHRKLVIIDGKIAYTGGMNIADEYINLVSPFGHWQDAVVRLTGGTIDSMIVTFLENWMFSTGEDLAIGQYKGKHDLVKGGRIIAFDDSPLDNELTTKNVFLQMISNATRSVMITTPYLIIDNELLTALKLAAKSGVEVKIIIPNIADKKLVLMVTESYVPELIESGVRIYRYQPGFIHSKMMIVDGKSAVFGTANFDFRSLYLHFENGIIAYDPTLVGAMLDYVNQTLEQSDEVPSMQKRNIFYRVLQLLLRGFAPLL